MTAAEFQQFIEGFANMLSTAGAIGQANTWRALLPIFEATPSASVKDVCKVIAAVRLAADADDVGMEEVVTSTQQLSQCLGENAKKAFIDDLAVFARTLGPFVGVSIADFTATTVMSLREAVVTPNGQAADAGDLIKTYLRSLEAALGDDEKFREVFGRLKRDSAMKSQQVKQLAKIFAGASGKTKTDALDRILARHESLTGAGARAKATGGRTAA
jgi:hypothetical protein